MVLDPNLESVVDQGVRVIHPKMVWVVQRLVNEGDRHVDAHSDHQTTGSRMLMDQPYG